MDWLSFISETMIRTTIILVGVTGGLWLLNFAVVFFNKLMFKSMGYTEEEEKEFKEYWKDKD